MAQHNIGEQPLPMLSQHLVLSLAEQLKVPLMQIGRYSELNASGGATDFLEIQTTADAAMKLLDNYILGVKLSLQDDYSLKREPVSVSAVLYDTSQELRALAKAYGVELELNVAGKYGPVMGHHQALQAALTSLGFALIEALPATGGTQLKLYLATHRCRYGIVAGLYADLPGISTEMLRRGRRLSGRAKQPLAGLTHANAAGVFVADSILSAMNSSVKVSRHQGLYGLGAVLQPNNQMSFV